MELKPVIIYNFKAQFFFQTGPKVEGLFNRGVAFEIALQVFFQKQKAAGQVFCLFKVNEQARIVNKGLGGLGIWVPLLVQPNEFVKVVVYPFRIADGADIVFDKKVVDILFVKRARVYKFSAQGESLVDVPLGNGVLAA